MSWTIKLSFTGGDETYTILSEGFGLKELVGEKGEHASQSVSVSIKSTAATASLLTETAKFVPAFIYDNNSNLVYQGVVRPYISTSVQHKNEEPLQLEIIDFTETLHIRICQDLSSYTDNSIDYSGVILVDDPKSNISLQNLVSYLFTLAGYTGAITWVPAESRSVEYFVLSDGDYMDEVIADLLYEYNLDYRFTTSGVEIISTDLSTTVTGTISSLINRLKVSRDDDTVDGVIVNYGDYRTAEHQRILYESYKKTWSVLKGDNIWETFSGYLYNHKKTYTAPTAGVRNYQFDLSAWQNDGGKVVALSNFDWGSSLRSNLGGYHTVHHDLESLKDNGARAYVECDTGFAGGWGYKIWCDADITYLANTSARCGYYGTDPDTISTSYIGNYTNAKALADNHFKRLKSSAVKYTFGSLSSFAVGRFYTLTESDVSSISSKIRIISREYDPTSGIYSYKAEGADDITITDTISTLEERDRSEVSDSNPFRVDLSYNVVNSAADSIIVTMQGYDAENADTLALYLNGTQVSSTRQTTLAGSAFAGGENTLEARAYYTGYADYQVAYAYVTRYYTDSEVQQIALTDNSSHIDVYASETLVEYTVRNASSKTVHLYANLVNVTGTTSWTINGVSYPAADGLIEFDYTFSTGTSGDFVFVCSAGGYTGTVTITRFSTDQVVYGGFHASDPTDITYIDGDFYFNTTDTQVYRYDGSSWNQVDSSDDEWQEMAACVVGDASFDDNADIATTSIVTLYVKNLAVNKIVANYLFTHNITVGDGTGLAGSGFRFRAHAYDSSGNKLATPLFDVMYDDQKIFEVVPSTGIIYFGSGFWYDPSDLAIHTANDNVLISSDGRLVAQNADIANGSFSGEIDTSSFSAKAGSGGTTYTSSGSITTTPTSSSASTAQKMAFYNEVMGYLEAMEAQGASIFGNGRIPCSLSGDSGNFYSYISAAKNSTVGAYTVSGFVFSKGAGTGSDYAYSIGVNYFSDGSYRLTFTNGSAQPSLISGTLSITIGAGQIFKFKNLPVSSAGLESGQIYVSNNTLMIVP